MAALVALLDAPDAVRTALSPMRQRLLRRLQTPASATEVAAEMDLPRQQINYHLRELENAGLLSLVETRKKRGCLERIVVASARAFVVDPSLVAGPDAAVPRAAAQDRFAAERLVSAAAGLVRDVTRMQAKADRQQKRLLTFTLETELGFESPSDVERFSTALAGAVARLAARFSTPRAARRYRVVIGGHPTTRPARLTGGASS